MPEAGSAGEEDTRTSKEIPWLIRLRENFRFAMATGVLSLYHADRKSARASGQPYIDLEREAEAMLIRE